MPGVKSSLGAQLQPPPRALRRPFFLISEFLVEGSNILCAALASYAKQSGDDELDLRFSVLMARRIKGRAVRRMGELLEQVPMNAGAWGFALAVGEGTSR